jgi:hypothetical protein
MSHWHLTHSFLYVCGKYLFVCLFMVLGTKPRAPNIADKCSTSELHPSLCSNLPSTSYA